MLLVNVLLIIEVGLLFAFSKSSPYRRYFPIILMLSFGIVMGLRVDVGRDYSSYIEIYENPQSYARLAVEPIWIFICDGLSGIGFKHRMFFLLTSFFIVYWYYKGIRRMSPNIYLSFIIFIACGLYGETANTIRQCCAQSLLFAATPYMLNKQWTKYFILGIIASIMHYSALVGIALMFFCLMKVSRRLLLLAVCLTFILGTFFMHKFAYYLSVISLVVNKYHYTPDSFDPGVSTGALRYVYNAIGLMVIILYNKLIREKYKMYFFINAVVIGVCLYNMFFMFMVMNRFTRYCFPFVMIVLPYAAYCFKPRSRIIAIGSTISMLYLFVLKTEMSVPYSFDFNIV